MKNPLDGTFAKPLIFSTIIAVMISPILGVMFPESLFLRTWSIIYMVGLGLMCISVITRSIAGEARPYNRTNLIVSTILLVVNFTILYRWYPISALTLTVLVTMTELIIKRE